MLTYWKIQKRESDTKLYWIIAADGLEHKIYFYRQGYFEKAALSRCLSTSKKNIVIHRIRKSDLSSAHFKSSSYSVKNKSKNIDIANIKIQH